MLGITTAARLSLDTDGIYVLAMSNVNDADELFPIVHYQFDSDQGEGRGFSGITNNNLLFDIITTDPGTQPLPGNHPPTHPCMILLTQSIVAEFRCLSPDLSNIDSRPQISEVIFRSDSSVFIEWTVPMASSDCLNVVASSPPLTYQVYLSSNERPIPQYNGSVS